jgi:MSHA biogenesis protein MshP
MGARSRSPHMQRQRGLGVIAAIIVVVVLASLGAAVLRLTWTQQLDSAQDINGARALQAANAGAEWGMFQAIATAGGWHGCTSTTQTLDLRSTMGFWVTVTCTSRPTAFVEGQQASGAARNVRLYVIDAVACNGAAACPDNTQATTLGYIERKRQVMVTDIDTDSDS